MRHTRHLLTLAMAASLLCSGTARAAETQPKTKPAVSSASQAQSTAMAPSKSKRTPCVDDEKVASGNPTGSKAGDGSNNPGAKKPNPPKCPQDIDKKVATPQ